MGGDADIGVGMNGPQQHPNHQEMEQRALAELQEHVLAAQQCEWPAVARNFCWLADVQVVIAGSTALQACFLAQVSQAKKAMQPK
eukprot:scaffold245547_cov18-Tisochrysis_lutea.AAC.1